MKANSFLIVCFLNVQFLSYNLSAQSDIILDYTGQWRIIDIEGLDLTPMGKLMEYNACALPFLFLELKPNGDAFSALTALHQLKWKRREDSTLILYSDSAMLFPMNQLEYGYAEYAKIILNHDGMRYTARMADDPRRTFILKRISHIQSLFEFNNVPFLQTDTTMHYADQLNGHLYRVDENVAALNRHAENHHKDEKSDLRFISKHTLVRYGKENRKPDTLKIEWLPLNTGQGKITNTYRILSEPDKYYQVKTTHTLDNFLFITIYEYMWDNATQRLLVEYKSYRKSRE